MPKRLPIKLGKEPLIEAVCEIRVGGTVALNAVLPGLFYSRYRDQVSELQQTAMALLPEEARTASRDLMHSPLVSLKCKGMRVLIGSRSISVSHTAPYSGWAAYKPVVEELFSIVLQNGLAESVERYSTKYANLLTAADVPDILTAADMNLSIGHLPLEGKTITVRAETVQGDFTTIISIAKMATLQVSGGSPREGVYLDIDTVSKRPPESATDFLHGLTAKLDEIRMINKAVFFDCLTDETIQRLEPEYE